MNYKDRAADMSHISNGPIINVFRIKEKKSHIIDS
jgi:hypothetical protein